MADVVLDSQFNWSPIRTGMDEMRAFATSTTRAIGKDVSGMFAGAAVAAGGLAAVTSALHSIVEEAHQIHEISDKFRIDSDALQTIGNAARDIGIPLETVASAMNKIELNAYKATQANNEQRKALEALGIQAEEFFKLSADEKILALADAYEHATDKAAAFANIAAIVGRRNTDLIRLMEQGSAAIREMGDQAKYTKEQLENIEHARRLWVEFGHELMVLGAGFFDVVVTPIIKGGQSINKAIADMVAGVKTSIAGLLSGDLQKALEGLQQFLVGSPEKPKSAPQARTPGAPLPVPGGEEPGPAGGAGAGGVAADEAEKALQKQIELSQKLAEIQRNTGMARLSDEGKLEALQRELNTLRAQEVAMDGGTVEQKQKLVEIAEKEAEIEKLSGTMADQKAAAEEKSAQLRERMAEAAEKEFRASQEATKEAQLELIGRKDLAERSKIEFEFNEKILDTKKEIQKADEAGLTEVANTNRALITQLNLEKQAALAAHDKARAEKMAAEAAAEGANVEKERGNLAVMQQENILLDLRLQGRESEAALLQIQFDFQAKINNALVEANDLWAQMNQAYSEGNIELGNQLAIHAQLKQAEADELGIEEQKSLQLERQNQALKEQQAQQQRAAAAMGPNPLTINALAEHNLRLGATSDVYAAALAASQGIQPGSPEYARLVQKIQAEDQLRMLQGKNLSFFDQLQRDRLVQHMADVQQQKATQAGDIAHQQEIDYWGAIASGHAPPPGNPYIGMFGMPNLVTGQMMPPPGALAPPTTEPVGPALQNLQTQNDKQTQLLTTIADNTKPVAI